MAYRAYLLRVLDDQIAELDCPRDHDAAPTERPAQARECQTDFGAQQRSKDAIEAGADLHFAIDVGVGISRQQTRLEAAERHQRQEYRRVGRREQHAKPIVVELGFQFSQPIAALVVADLVGAAPQHRMLRHGDDRAAAGGSRRAQRAQRGLVIRHMLYDVVGAGEVEGLDCWNRTGIQLSELDTLWQPCARMRQTFCIQIGADEAVPIARLGDRLENCAIAAADFQIAPRLRKYLSARATISSLRATNQKCVASTLTSLSNATGSNPLTVSAKSGANMGMSKVSGTFRPQAVHCQPGGQTASSDRIGS